MGKVLVAGGAGYIGGAVTNLLQQEGIPFTVYDNLLYEPHFLKSVDFVYGDIRDRKKLAPLLPNYTHVIWLAGIVGDGACQVNPPLTVEVNQESVRWLAENFRGRIIFASTCSVYGQHDSEVDETSPLNPLSLYAQTKLEAEKVLDHGNSLIFRLGTAFGVSDTYSRPRMDLVVNYMTASALTKGKLCVFGGGQWRPLVHVRDIGRAMVANLEKPVRGVYNLAAANLQIRDLASVVSGLTGCAVEHSEQKFQDQRDYRVSTAKALRDGIFNPNTMHRVEDGVREIAELVRVGRIKYADHDTYFNVRHVEKLMKNGQFA